MSFIERLKFVLAERAITPWAKSLGMGSGTADRLREGIPPAAESLTIVTRVENVSLSWLLEGLGRPFLASVALSDEEAAELLAIKIGDEPGRWTLHLVTDGARHAVVLTQPGAFLRGQTRVPYTIVEVTAGALGRLTERALRKVLPPVAPAFVHRVTPADMTDLERGWLGTWKLVGTDRKHVPLLNRGVPATTADIQKVLLTSLAPEEPDERDPGKPHSLLDAELLQTCLAGAAEALKTHGIEVPPDKFAQLVTLLYEYYEARGGAPDDVTFARFIALAS